MGTEFHCVRKDRNHKYFGKRKLKNRLWRVMTLGRYPPQPVSPLGPATTLSPSFLLAQAIFEPNIFPYKYANIFKLTRTIRSS